MVLNSAEEHRDQHDGISNAIEWQIEACGTLPELLDESSWNRRESHGFLHQLNRESTSVVYLLALFHHLHMAHTQVSRKWNRAPMVPE